MPDGNEGQGQSAAESAGSEGQGQQQEQTFTQADIDRLVSKARGEERRKATERFADYDDLKSKAEGAKTLEQQFSDLKAELASTKVDAIRTRIAAEYGISTKAGPNGEPSDADLFLTGTTAEILTAQAARLGQQQADRKKQGNVAPREGTTRTTGKGDEAVREFARDLFGSAE
jgi:hypothetical protein